MVASKGSESILSFMCIGSIAGCKDLVASKVVLSNLQNCTISC